MAQLHTFLVADVRSILVGKVISYTYKKGVLGSYFLVEEVKKQGSYFLCKGTGNGEKKEVKLSHSEVWLLQKNRKVESSFKVRGIDVYMKYVLC